VAELWDPAAPGVLRLPSGRWCRADAFVREHYDRRAVETFWQRPYLARWRAGSARR
jgi:hypothetical protein